MSLSSDISGRFWNLPQKGEEEAAREQNFIDDIISKAHIERLLLENLDGIRTAFDGGGGAGRFSLLLAARGVHVTHFDISQPMIDRARQFAERRGLTENITFVLGKLENLSAYADRQFDLVMSLDAPICYTWPNHERVVGELVRIASKRLCVSVYSRAATVAYNFDPSSKEKYILTKSAKDTNLGNIKLRSLQKRRKNFRPDFAAAREIPRTGLPVNPDEIAAAFERGETPWPVSYASPPASCNPCLSASAHRMCGCPARARWCALSPAIFYENTCAAKR